MASNGASGPAAPPPRRVLFVTGKLAEPALRRVLEEMQPPFETRRRGHEDHGRGADDHAVDRAISRGSRRAPIWCSSPASARATWRCSGSGSACGWRRARKTCARSPATSARPRPRRTTAPTASRFSPRSTTPPSSPLEAIMAAAEYFRSSGADLIDVGCTPGLAFPELGDVVRALRRGRHAGQHRQLRPARDPDRGGGRRGDGAERQPVQPGCGAGARGHRARPSW